MQATQVSVKPCSAQGLLLCLCFRITEGGAQGTVCSDGDQTRIKLGNANAIIMNKGTFKIYLECLQKKSSFCTHLLNLNIYKDVSVLDVQ